ncbi:calcium/proton exchanger [Kwoniella heveanensis CBS 569]|nr:calcium/proton exchanger [Kwoniella heveanensis CBS 569]
MINAPILEPEPEPDIGGFNSPFNQSTAHTNQSQAQTASNDQPVSTYNNNTTNNQTQQDAFTNSPGPIGLRSAQSKRDDLDIDANVNPQQPAPVKSSFARTLLKPRSGRGHSRMPSITITGVDDPSTIKEKDRGRDELAIDEPIDGCGIAQPPPPPRSNSAPPVSRNRLSAPLAPLRNISIPLPPKMGPPEGEDEHVKKTFIEPTWKQCFTNTIKSQPALCAIPILLPVAWALHFSHQDPIAVFVTSLLAIVPLAGGLGFATEELAHRVGEAWGGLLNASFGNAVELLIAILALVKGDIDIVQASMVGSILSNVLLVLGMSYFAGGLRFHEQLYTIIGAQMHISLLGISLLAIVLPAAYHVAYPAVGDVVSNTRSGAQAPEGEELANLLKMSRGLSFILLAVYGMFLTFQLYTHSYLFRVPREKIHHPLPGPAPHHESVFPRPHWVSSIADSSSSSSSSSASSVHSGRSDHFSPFRRFRRFSVTSKAARRQRDGHDADTEENTVVGSNGHEKTLSASTSAGAPVSPVRSRSPVDDNFDPVVSREEIERERDIEAASIISSQNVIIDDDGTVHVQPKVKFWFALGMLLTMTALAGVSAEFLVDSIDGLTENGHVSREFVGLILLPVIGNSVEHITAVTVSVKDKLNLSMSIAVGSSIQVSLCLLPILVLIGWAIGQPMLLFFDNFETITLVVSLLLVNFAISDGRTNYLEGFVMMMAYLSIALVCWFYDPVI